MQTRLFPAAPGLLLQFSLSYVVPVLLAVVLCFQISPPAAEPAGLHPLGPPGGRLHRRFLWEAAKHLFKWYVLAFSSYSLVYGSLSAAAVLLVWTWFSAAVLLLARRWPSSWSRTAGS